VTDNGTRSQLTPEHEQYLTDHAVDVELAKRLGVRSLLSHDDNPAEGVWPNWSNHPAILFPWTSPEGRVEYQVRPDDPTTDRRSGKPRKYVFAKDMTPVLWALREVQGSELVVIIEGTKQGLAGASYAPPGASIYSMAGCRMWQTPGGGPIPDLAVADGKDVVVILDADAATNPEVYEAGMGLAAALAAEGATKVTFGRLPGGADKSGLDDILAGRPAERRASYLKRVIDGAKPKPADAKPRPRKKTGGAPVAGDGRATIICNRDRLEVINDLAKALLDRWNASRLFNHGGVISWLSDEETMAPVDRGSFHDLVQATAITVNENEGAQGTTYAFTWPDAGTMSATMSRANRFAALDRIAHAPFVRPDGTIVTEPGYDEVTRTLLMSDEVFAGVEVPEDPSAADITAARELLLEEWLGDFPLDGEADRANLLALLVTPAIRGNVPRAPLAVIDGLQMGVGKNLLADVLLTVYTGHAAQPMNWVSEPDEIRKQVTAAFRTGAEFFVYDEAHTLEGAPLAQALTAETWQDRILGVSNMASFPNKVTWMSLGNNVQVKGDITRRVYRIALRPKYANPQDRQASSFRHPGQSGLDLGSWTRKHRRDLLVAILTLVRAWFAQGAPSPKRGVSFGSFEAWERMVGGIVEVAGLPGFLGNLKVWRSESDFDTQYWINHLEWLKEQFGDATFRTAEVKAKALTGGTDLYSAPPRLDDPTERTYGKALGEAYSRISGRHYGQFWLQRMGSAHGHVSVYQVFTDDDLPPWQEDPEPEPTEPDTHVSSPQPVENPVDIPMPEPGPENEHAEARGPAPEDTDGEGHDEERGPAAIVHGEAPGLLGEMERALAAEGLDSNGEPVPAPTAAVTVLDLETGDIGDQFKTNPRDYIRLAGWAHDNGPVATTDRDTVTHARHALAGGRVTTGHNIMAFDLPVMVRAGAFPMTWVHEQAAAGNLADTLLMARYVDPPMARDKGVDATRKYDLGALAVKYGAMAKLSDVSKALAKKYGGWGEIPVDTEDPDAGRAADAASFREYLEHDVGGSRGLYAALLEELGGTMPDYLVREHRVAAIAAQISHNGFLVDQPLLAQRVEEIQRRKAESMALLAGKYGIPTADAKGKEYASPLASKLGKEALEAALLAAGVRPKALWRTPNSGDLQISADAMLHYGREYGGNKTVLEIVKAVYRIVSARSIYETAQNAMGPDGRVHPKISFKQATGRWSSTEPGLTVFGKRGGRHVERAVLLPDPGQLLVAFDLSQVDMRAVAGLSQDLAYIEMLKTDDPHTELALALFGDPGMRETAKPIGHGWNYGESLKRISMSNNIEPHLVVQFDRMMRERFSRLVEWQDEVRALASSGQLLDNGFGRLMRPDPQRAHTQGPALMGQGAARDIMMAGCLNLPAEVLPMLRAQVHDEIVLSIPADLVEDVSRVVVDALSLHGEPWRGVPILADRSPAGTDWSKCYEK
jgi:hypothetical protein